MTSTYKREAVWYFDRGLGGRRLRFSLGTRLPQAARTLARQIETAIAEGPKSEIWSTLKIVLPPSSYEILASSMRLTAQPALAEFEKLFQDHLSRRAQLGEIASSSRQLYDWAATQFFARMAELGVRKMDEITPTMCEEYLCWRKEAILKRGGSGRGLQTESTVLSQIFDLAMEAGVIKSSPLRTRYKPDVVALKVDPFTPEEILKLGAAAEGITALALSLLRWTGLRGSDAAELTWDAIDFSAKTLRWRTKKRGKVVTIPLATELKDRLHAEFSAKWPEPEARVIPGVTRAKLYRMMADLGKKAGVSNVHPHRLRHTFACDLLARGATLFDVAAMLGDSHAVTDSHYAAITDKQQERVRELLG